MTPNQIKSAVITYHTISGGIAVQQFSFALRTRPPHQTIIFNESNHHQ